MARQAQGYDVKVVNVEEVYRQFAYSVFDPYAIKEYINYAVENMGANYVMLVGGDTYDYRHYKYANVKSFIPSLYAKVESAITQAPVDPLYVDLNSDNIPDVPIGRLPVLSSEQLASVVSKLLTYDSKSS